MDGLAGTRSRSRPALRARRKVACCTETVAVDCCKRSVAQASPGDRPLGFRGRAFARHPRMALRQSIGIARPHMQLRGLPGRAPARQRKPTSAPGNCGRVCIAALSRARIDPRLAASFSLEICSAAETWSFACRTTSSHDLRLSARAVRVRYPRDEPCQPASVGHRERNARCCVHIAHVFEVDGRNASQCSAAQVKAPAAHARRGHQGDVALVDVGYTARRFADVDLAGLGGMSSPENDALGTDSPGNDPQRRSLRAGLHGTGRPSRNRIRSVRALRSNGRLNFGHAPRLAERL